MENLGHFDTEFFTRSSVGLAQLHAAAITCVRGWTTGAYMAARGHWDAALAHGEGSNPCGAGVESASRNFSPTLRPTLALVEEEVERPHCKGREGDAGGKAFYGELGAKFSEETLQPSVPPALFYWLAWS